MLTCCSNAQLLGIQCSLAEIRTLRIAGRGIQCSLAEIAALLSYWFCAREIEGIRAAAWDYEEDGILIVQLSYHSANSLKIHDLLLRLSTGSHCTSRHLNQCVDH